MIVHKIKKLYYILKNATIAFIDDDVIRMCASLSFYTIFSLPPLLMVMIALSGIFFGTDAVQGQLFQEIKMLIGVKVATQIEDVVRNLKLYNSNGAIALVAGFIFLFGESGVFSEIQNSIHKIWNIDTKQKKGIVHYFRKKIMSFAMVGSVSFLLIVCLIISAIIDLVNKRLELLFRDTIILIIHAVNELVIFSIITILFVIIFKSLPEKRLKWKYIMVAAISSTFMFMIGKYLISVYIGNSTLVSIYGAAGTIIMLLIWVYYSSAILFFGAEIAKAYAKSNNEFD